MKKILFAIFIILVCIIGIGQVKGALVEPNEIMQPGTQPGEAGNLELSTRCDNCHGGYNPAVEPVFNWSGSMMANATRDPIFWATLAIAEQDFDGSGDLCLRCHSTSGWYGGRSTPTDGSALTSADVNGVECDFCHKLTNPDNSEYAGNMIAPFIANDEETPATGYYGSGMASIWSNTEKLGPYSDAAATHQFLQSAFHRDVDFCGTCHDVSNPAVGDLAHNNGAQPGADSVIASGVLGSAVDGKAAFNNFPYQYGIVERTFSEYKAGSLSETLVSEYAILPEDLKSGAVQAAYENAGGNYADGTDRYFSCQTCHLPPVTGQGCNKNPPVRSDLPLHDMTGGNYWMPDAMIYQDSVGNLLLGGGLDATQTSALLAGKQRAQTQLNLAASLSVTDNTIKVTNLTGHKLISGYPEGRRMWLNIKWYDSENVLLREDGKYDVVTAVNGTPVKSLVDLEDPNTKVYESHYGMTQEWANQLIGLGYAGSLPISYDRLTGDSDYTLADLAAQEPGTSHISFHFVLNNTVISDNRIPPYGMNYEEARQRNTLPVPASQFGNPGLTGSYNYWDEFTMSPPAGAVYAEIRLMYQSTSWEYIQFLYEANNGLNSFLANEGINLLDAWLHTNMAEPYVMASTNWGSSALPPENFSKISPENGATGQGTSLTLDWQDSTGATSYEYCIDTTNDDSCSSWVSSGTMTSVTIDGLAHGQTYYWQVKAHNESGDTYANENLANFWSFTTEFLHVYLPNILR